VAKTSISYEYFYLINLLAALRSMRSNGGAFINALNSI
jgi:hypothetical protein